LCHLPYGGRWKRRARRFLIEVPPGPENPLGKYWIQLSIGGIGIHGTIAPQSIYRFRSHGCMRLRPEVAELLFKELQMGTKGKIIYRPVKVMKTSRGRVLLEVYRDFYRKGIDYREEVKKRAVGAECGERGGLEPDRRGDHEKRMESSGMSAEKKVMRKTQEKAVLTSQIPLWGPEIKFVLLDMDGTLLDKYFDDYFWERLVPEKYAERHGITFGRAMDELMEKYKRHEGTLNWTDIDFWSAELDLDIPALKEQIKHLIEVHPHVEDFLKKLKRYRKKLSSSLQMRISKVLDLKLKETNIGRYFDACITSFEIGCPKEDLLFWERLRQDSGLTGNIPSSSMTQRRFSRLQRVRYQIHPL